MAPMSRAGPLLTCLLLVSLSVFSQINAVDLHPEDISTLSQVLGNMTEIPAGWSRNASALVGACSGWPGLGCSDQGRIERFTMYQVNISSTIPKAIGLFPSLIELQLLTCNVLGSIPDEIFLPRNLSSIDFRNNYLTGSIPAAISNAVNLEKFRVGFNALGGVLPAALNTLPKLIDVDFGRNRFECPFPVGLFEKLKNMPSGTNCQFWGNNWDLPARDGRYCNGTVNIPVGDQACEMFPFTTVHHVKRNPSSIVLPSPTMHVEVHGNYIAFFPKFQSGAVYRDEYLGARFQSVELYDVVAPQTYLTPPQAAHFATFPIDKFDNITQVSQYKWEMTAYWSGQRIQRLTLFWDFNSTATVGGVKFSAQIVGQDNIFQNRSFPGAISLATNFEARGYMFTPTSRLACGGSSSLYFGQTVCGTELFNTTLEMVVVPTTLTWIHETRNIQTSLDSPFEFFADGRTTPLAWYPRRYGLGIPGYGPAAANRYSQIGDPVLVDPDEQGISVQLELLFANITREMYWDPTISLSILLPDPGVPPPPTSAPSSGVSATDQSVNLAVAIAVPVVVIIVVSIIAIIALVPSVRRKFFTAEAVLHEVRRRQMKSGAVETGPSPSTSAAPNTSNGWTAAKRPTTLIDA